MSDEKGILANDDAPNGAISDPLRDAASENASVVDSERTEEFPAAEVSEKESDDTNENVGFHPTRKLELQSILFENLSKGFTELRNRQLGEHEDSNISPSRSSFLSVNFIDTTSGVSATSASPQKFSLLGQRGSKATTSETTLSLNLYEKFSRIFEREFACTLQAVAYENVRNGAAGVVEKLRIRPVLANRENAPSTLAPEGDPAEWHNGAYCHVYIAACESMEHYRGKVRPSLQAFVSQIGGPATSGLAASLPRRNSLDDSSSLHGNFSPHFVVVYVPVGAKHSTVASSSEGTATRVGAALASRMAAARRQLQHTGSRDFSSDSVHSQATNGTDGTDSELDSSELPADLPQGPTVNVSKMEKDIFKKFATDFPNGNACIMSTLLDTDESDAWDTRENSVKSQEWNTFLRLLGGAVANGFKDRCRRYDEELRRLDAQRASVTNSSSHSISSIAVGRNRFDFSNFFCVKESLAFTYEQMQMPAEALLQYEELRAFVPELVPEDRAGSNEKAKQHKRTPSSSWRKAADFEDQTMLYAVAGDSTEFRRKLRSSKTVAPVSHVILQYLFSRESSLLFQLGDAVEIVKRSRAFVGTSYKNKIKSIDMQEPPAASEDTLDQRSEAEVWALSCCWHIKCACDKYFASLQTDEPKIDHLARESDDEFTSSIATDRSSGGTVSPEGVQRTVVSKIDLARSIAELLEFARLRLLTLGDVNLSGGNPVRALRRSRPDDVGEPWEAWEAIETPADDILMSKGVGTEKDQLPNALLDGAFDSTRAYEDCYLKLASALTYFDESAGRHRSAAKIQGELAEILIRRGDRRSAADILLSIVDVPASDHWDRGNFWLLFRLACCQRTLRNPGDYLRTIIRCFGSRLSPTHPAQTAELLQTDLEAVVEDAEIAKVRLGVACFLDVEISVDSHSTGKATAPLDYIRKRVAKSFCAVGETMRLSLNITSHLPKAIDIDKLEVFLVPFQEFESFVREKGQITDDFVELAVRSPITVVPGSSNFSVDWTPMSTGQYVVATVQMQWKEASFSFDCATLRRHLTGIDVLPSDPTHTVEINPLFLMPGHVQQVRIVFHAGSDVIRSGKVQLDCSNGLAVIPPGTVPNETAWVQSCHIDLPSCSPQGTTVLTTYVKSEILSATDTSVNTIQDNGAQSLVVKIATSYHHKLIEQSQQSEESPRMKTVLEARVTTLDRPALTIDETDVVPIGNRKSLLRATLHCNTPEPFSIKEWQLTLPKLKVTEEGDMNGDILDQAVVEGDQIAVGFICEYSSDSSELSIQPHLRMVLQDHFGKSFEQILALDLVDFYDRMKTNNELVVPKLVTAELQCSSIEGLVGAPVDLKFTLLTSGIPGSSGTRRIHYSVSSDADWVVGGKVEGELGCDKERLSLEFVGIPTRPGVLRTFPEISVTLASPGQKLPLDLHCRGPESFKSLSFVNHMALAYPVVIDKRAERA